MKDNDLVSEGFKITELGPLPETWEVVRLGEIIEEVKEKNKLNTKYPVFTVSNVYGFILSDKFFDKQVYSKQTGTTLIISDIPHVWTQRDFDTLRRNIVTLAANVGIKRDGYEEDPGFI